MSTSTQISLLAEHLVQRRSEFGAFATTDGYSVSVADTCESVEALRPIWQAWTCNLNTDLDYYLHSVKNDSAILRPYVITIWRDGVPQAILVGQVRKLRVLSVVSFVNIHGPKAKMLEIVTGGRLGVSSADIDRLFAVHLHRALRTAGVDYICLQRWPLASELLRQLQQVPGMIIKNCIPHIFRYSMVPLTAPAGKRPRALSGKNGREVRRKTRILEQHFPGKVRFRCFSPAELEDGLRDAMVVDAATWQHHAGSGVLNTPHAVANLAFCARRDWLRIYVMYVEDSPVAFLIGQSFKTTFYCQYAGYDPDFARYSVGSLLTAWALESLAAAGVLQVDLGEGSQEHNRRLGCEFSEEGIVHIYAPSPRGLYVNLFFGATTLIRGLGRHVRSEFRLAGLGRAWSHLVMRARRS